MFRFLKWRCNVAIIIFVSGTNDAMQRLLFILLFVTGICFSCRKSSERAGEVVEIYLLKTFQTVFPKCQVDASLSTIQDIPVIKNQDILEYSKLLYQFKLTDAAIQKVKNFADKTPFAVTVDKQVIYYGFFKPGISSSSCDESITMDVDWTSGNKISLKLGYPAPLPEVFIEDKRNDEKLIRTLKKQGKLD